MSPITTGVELYLPSRKTLQDLFVPSENDLAEGVSRCQVFNFTPVNPFQTLNQVWVADRPLLVTQLAGTMVQSTPPGPVIAAGFRLQINQTREKIQRQWFQKPQIAGNVLGSGGLPFLLRNPQLIATGDIITITVSSLVAGLGAPAPNQIATIQVCLFGVQPDEQIHAEIYQQALQPIAAPGS